MPALLMSKTLWMALAATIVGGYLIHWGDANGFNARRVRAMERSLADANSRIAGYTQRDDQAAIDADLLRSEGYHKAVSELGTADKCLVTPAMARAFVRITP